MIKAFRTRGFPAFHTYLKHSYPIIAQIAIGSWLYRMDYGFWLMLTDGLGHTGQFTGPFDIVMFFFFYIPNLLVVETWIHARQYKASVAVRFVTTFILLFATTFLVVGTYYFTLYYWGHAILKYL